MDHHKFSLYLNGNWIELVNLSKSEIQQNVNTGDSVQLTCLLSQYGCCQINLGNQHEAHIIYQFLKNEKYLNGEFTTKEQAFVYSFLAIYTLFEGNLKQSNYHYGQSMEAFLLIDEAIEETIMLMEAFRWLYCLLDDQEKKAYIHDRLHVIGHPLVNQMDFNFTGKNDEIIARFKNYIYFFSKNAHDSHPLISLFQTLFESLRLGENEKVQTTIYSLLAKANQYKHPLLKAWGYFIASHILDNSDYLEKAINLFENFQVVTAFTGGNSLKDRSINKTKIPQSKTANLSFLLFKEFTIRFNANDYSKIKWERKKAEELLIYLLTQPNLEVDKELLLEEFYPEEDSKKAGNRLYVILHSINKKFSNLGLLGEPIVSIKGGKVRLHLHLIEEIDIQVYLKLYSVGRQLWFAEREEAVELFEKAHKLYDNEFVNHILYADWLNQYRIQLKEKHVDLLQKLYSFYHDKNAKEQLLHELMECDPFNEDIIQENLLFLKEQGRFFEAKQYYKKQKVLLKEELGIEFNLDADVVP